jgi:hypothetical protein
MPSLTSAELVTEDASFPLGCSSKTSVELCLIVSPWKTLCTFLMSSEEPGLSLWLWPTQWLSPLSLPPWTEVASGCQLERGYHCHSTRGRSLKWLCDLFRKSPWKGKCHDGKQEENRNISATKTISGAELHTQRSWIQEFNVEEG